MSPRLSLATLCCLLTASPAIHAASAPRQSQTGAAATPVGRPPMDAAGALAQRIFERTAATGLVVAVVRENDVWIGTYGQTSPSSGKLPQPDSLVHLCSISKILATDLFAKLIADKKVAFTTPLQTFAPAGSRVPTLTVRGPARREVTLFDLATHTAGLPREIAYPPTGMAHFTFPDYGFRWNWLPTARLRSSPGDRAHYSNISFDLLADSLSKATGEPYQNLFQERTATPLGMVDTTLTPTPAQCARLMSGWHEPAQCVDTTAAAGSGGMYSTADDMVRFLKYLLYLPGVPVHQNGISTGMYLDPYKLASTQGLGHAGLPDGIGLGWIEINKNYGDARIIEKTGGGAGFQTYIALNPARHAGIFIAATDGRGRSGANLFRESNNLLLYMAGLPPVPSDPDDPERERTPAELAEAAKAARAGKAAHRKSAAGRVRADAAARHSASGPVRTRAAGKHAVPKTVKRGPAASSRHHAVPAKAKKKRRTP